MAGFLIHTWIHFSDCFTCIFSLNMVLIGNLLNLSKDGVNCSFHECQRCYHESSIQKQPSSAVLTKKCSENMPQIYRRTPIPKCNFNKVVKHLYWNHTSACNFIEITLRHGCSPANLLHICRAPFPKNNPGGLLLNI